MSDDIREVEFEVRVRQIPGTASYEVVMVAADGRGCEFRSGPESTPDAAYRNLGWMRDQAEEWASRFGCEIKWPKSIKVTDAEGDDALRAAAEALATAMGYRVEWEDGE